MKMMISRPTVVLIAALAIGSILVTLHSDNKRRSGSLTFSSQRQIGQDDVPVHAQCARGNPQDLKERPLLIFKYARTGSTWLSWTGATIKLESGKEVAWTHEVPKCGARSKREPRTTERMIKWFKEYFGRVTDGEIINLHKDRENKYPNKCVKNAGKDPNDLGMIIATYNPQETNTKDSPEITEEQWQGVFDAVPDLAVGVLVRTNAVKRAISASASPKEFCGGSHKLTEGEDCIKELPKTIHVDLDYFWNKIKESEKKRAKVTALASRLSTKFGDGRIFCLSYEGMQQDIVGEIRDLGEFVGAPVDERSLHELGNAHVSHKRGSDDLSTYIDNYDEVYESLSKNPCLLRQLLDTGSETHPLCGVYTGDEVEDVF